MNLKPGGIVFTVSRLCMFTTVLKIKKNIFVSLLYTCKIKNVLRFCTCKIKNFLFRVYTYSLQFLNCKKIFFLTIKQQKSRGYKPRLIILNVLYTSFMNSLLNIKNIVIPYSLFITHGRCLFCYVGIFVILFKIQPS